MKKITIALLCLLVTSLAQSDNKEQESLELFQKYLQNASSLCNIPSLAYTLKVEADISNAYAQEWGVSSKNQKYIQVADVSIAKDKFLIKQRYEDLVGFDDKFECAWNGSIFQLHIPNERFIEVWPTPKKIIVGLVGLGGIFEPFDFLAPVDNQDDRDALVLTPPTLLEAVENRAKLFEQLGKRQVKITKQKKEIIIKCDGGSDSAGDTFDYEIHFSVDDLYLPTKVIKHYKKAKRTEEYTVLEKMSIESPTGKFYIPIRSKKLVLDDDKNVLMSESITIENINTNKIDEDSNIFTFDTSACDYFMDGEKQIFVNLKQEKAFPLDKLYNVSRK